VPRRGLAQELCDAGVIAVNGSPAKSSKEVRIGDRLTIRRRSRVTEIEVLSLPPGKQVSKSAAADLYRVMDEKVIDDDPLV